MLMSDTLLFTASNGDEGMEGGPARVLKSTLPRVTLRARGQGITERRRSDSVTTVAVWCAMALASAQGSGCACASRLGVFVLQLYIGGRGRLIDEARGLRLHGGDGENRGRGRTFHLGDSG